MTDLGASLLSPAVLCFVLGAAAHGLRSDLRLPDAMFSVLSAYLMLAIGLKGGAALAATPLAAFAGPAAGALALGCAIPVWTYALLRRVGGFSAADAAAVAAHYGSVSAVTFAAVIDGLGRAGVAFEGYAAALLALLEAPAILVALALGGLGGARGGAGHGGTGQGALGRVLAEVATGKSIVLLVGGLAIAPTMIAAMTMVEQGVPAGRLTEGMAILHTGIVAGVAPGASVAGFVVDHSGASAAYAVALVGGLLGALAAQAARPAPSLRT